MLYVIYNFFYFDLAKCKNNNKPDLFMLNFASVSVLFKLISHTYEKELSVWAPIYLSLCDKCSLPFPLPPPHIPTEPF